MYAEQKNKTCTKCCETKPVEDYYIRNKETGLRYPQCKTCEAKRKKISYQKIKHIVNPKRYEYNKQYRLNNPDKVKFWQSNWREQNYELSKELHKRYYRKNKKKRQASSRKYTLNKINATPKWLSKIQLKEIEVIYETCPVGFHVDHIVPLRAKNVCGLHVAWNLQHLPAKDNLKKGNRF